MLLALLVNLARRMPPTVMAMTTAMAIMIVFEYTSPRSSRRRSLTRDRVSHHHSCARTCADRMGSALVDAKRTVVMGSSLLSQRQNGRHCRVPDEQNQPDEHADHRGTHPLGGGQRFGLRFGQLMVSSADRLGSERFADPCARRAGQFDRRGEVDELRGAEPLPEAGP